MSINKLTVIVPVFNEKENLERLFHAFKVIHNQFSQSYEPQFILVDDGSTDGTPQVIRDKINHAGLSITLLVHAGNQGPGRAFGTAFFNLADSLKDDDWVVTMEGDNTSRYELLGQMLQRTWEGYEIILASPYMYGGGVLNTTLFRVITSTVANIFVKEFYGVSGIITVSSFFRLYKGSAIKLLQHYYGPRIVEKAGFECMLEMLIKMVHLRMAISEVPMVLDTSLRKGKSKMKIYRTIMAYLTLWKDVKRWRSVKADRLVDRSIVPVLIPDGDEGPKKFLM